MMNKLTERDEYGNADIIGVDSEDLQMNLGFDELNKVTDALNKLAAYEETELTPKEIKKISNVLQEFGETYNCHFNYVKDFILKYAEAERDGRLVVLPCKVGESYAGICREMRPTKNGWETHNWVETGIIKGFEVIANMTAEKVHYDHIRSVEELDEVWFIGESAREKAEQALKGTASQ